NFLGPLVFKENEAPYYTTGWITTVATSAGAVVLAISYREALDLRRDKSGEMEDFENAFDDDLTDLTNRQFRYTL
ncbi:hypothetical protein D0869_16408, partial [Hortaea werneckii]